MQSIIVIQVYDKLHYMKTCSFLNAHYTETMKTIENAYGEQLIHSKDICCRCTTFVTENEENYYEIYTSQVSCPFSLPLLNTSNSQSVLKYMSPYCKLFIFA